MVVLAVCGGLLLAIALFLRENQLNKERCARAAAFDQLQKVAETLHRQLRQSREDVFVLKTLMLERGLFSEDDFARSRVRLVEAPRRRAEERSEILRNVEIPSRHVLVDEGDSVH